MDWIVHGVAKSRTQLSNFHFPWKTKEERKSFLFTLISVGEGRCRPSALRSKEQRSWLCCMCKSKSHREVTIQAGQSEERSTARDRPSRGGRELLKNTDAVGAGL